MPNYSAKILNNSVSALTAQQAVIATSANNIANVNTPGYTRRVAELQTRASGSGSTTTADVGSGVEVAEVVRQADEFLERLMRDAGGDKGESELINNYLSRVDALFDLTGTTGSIGSSLNEFFAAVNQVALNPASLELRTVAISRSQDLVSAIKNSYETAADLQTELDQRLGTEIQTINSLTSQIAVLNGQIGAREASGATAGDERDQRSVLINKLADKIGFDLIEVDRGQVNISLANGFPLVNGTTARKLETTVSPSFANGGTLPPSLSGGILSYVVCDFGGDASDAHLDLTRVIQAGNGSLGGLLKLRGYAAPTNTSAFQADGGLVAVASRIEAITRQLLTVVNRKYLGDADENPGVAGHQASALDLNGVQPGVFGLFTVETTAGVLDDGDGEPEIDQDLVTATGFDNFSSVLKLGISAPSEFAAGLDLDGTAGVLVVGQGDGRNAKAVADLQNSIYTFAVGSSSVRGTFGEAFNDLVTYVGNAKANAEATNKVAGNAYITAQNRRDEISAVSLDEEFAGLVKYQKAFESSARMVRVAQELLDQIVNLI